MIQTHDKQRIIDHYDRISPYYRALWGEHLHHGYWIHGNEPKDVAQDQLVEHLAQAANIQQGATILDVGCGYGGSSIYLARKYAAKAIGITISPVQVEMATRSAAQAGVSASFLCMDAEAIDPRLLNSGEPFDVIWSVESISHYQDVPAFFASAANLLRPGGVLAITDWFKRESLPPREHKKHLHPIEDGMMIVLHTVQNYEGYLASAGLLVLRSDVLNKQCAKSWDIGLDIIKDKALWQLAAKYGPEFLRFLRAFKAMRSGFSTGNFVYGLLVARKPGSQISPSKNDPTG
jgi:tocopherol O-methyltransferase